MTITEFLLARLDEEEAAARRYQWVLEDGPLMSSSGSPWEIYWVEDHDLEPTDLAITPSRVLADVQAKRSIVEIHRENERSCRQCAQPYDEDWDTSFAADYPCLTTRALAAVYADHPDYREEWRP